MTNEKEKRLKELETKWKLVHKGTGETYGRTGPGGAPAVIDSDTYEWTGTEDEEREYNTLRFERIQEQMTETTNNFKKTLANILYGGKNN